MKIIKVISAAMLLIALAKLPYDYYKILRIVIFISGIICAIDAIEKQRIFVLLFAAIAILFNPIIPIYLKRSTWQPIDIIAALIFLVSIYFDEKKSEKNDT